MQLQAQAGLEERARHPGGGKAEQAARAGQLGADLGGRVALEGLELRDVGHDRESVGKIGRGGRCYRFR